MKTLAIATLGLILAAGASMTMMAPPSAPVIGPVPWPGNGTWPMPTGNYRTTVAAPVQPGHLYVQAHAKALSDGATIHFWQDCGVGVADKDSSTGPSWRWYMQVPFQIDDTLAQRPYTYVAGAMQPMHFPRPSGTREWQPLYTAGGDTVYGYPMGLQLVFNFPAEVVPE
jgi:hypothetical protein